MRLNVEAQEREEQSAGRVIKLVKGKVGKPKAKKMNLEETMPSPFGRRVDPPTQPVKSDAAKKLTKKKKADLDPAVKLEFDDDEGGTAENSVSKPKTPRVKKEKKEPGAPRVRKPPAPKGTPAKKVKKRNPWSDDESKSESELEENEPVIPRETKSQRASASKPKYTFDFSEEEDEEDEAADEEEKGGDDAASSPVRSLKDDFGFSENKSRFNDNDDEEDELEVSFSPPKPKKAVPAKKEITSSFLSKTTFSEKSNDSDGSKSDSDDDNGPVFNTYSSSSVFDKLSQSKKVAKKPSDAAPKPRKAPAAKAKKPDKSIWDSDSDTGSKKSSATPKGKGRGRKRKGSESEDEYSPMKRASKPSGRKPQKPPSDDDDDNSNSLSAVGTLSREQPGRAKKEMKYFNDMDDDDEDNDDMFD
ncbi:hypothetical protein OJAV_G00109910 [Oryzias javanicus]|uniref:DTHCT domain-containing protein n=1 Tax=Oryzias javanicus TaxID=123683 RepID=A0A3S2UAK4_ORYJA|nr:hypothetical protein OJAV_G00109910 [Oryzias javanicus]